MELKFSNDTNFIKFWPLPAEILSATHHYPIHPGHYIPNIPDISVSLLIYGIFGIHVPVFIEVYVFDTA